MCVELGTYLKKAMVQFGILWHAYNIGNIMQFAHWICLNRG